jgi:hypothetical protein
MRRIGGGPERKIAKLADSISNPASLSELQAGASTVSSVMPQRYFARGFDGHC